MNFKKCIACKKKFTGYPQVPDQRYCSQINCQRERRRKTQQTKIRQDPDYRDNQLRAQKAWSKKNVSYWRNYRKTHPNYVERNKQLQRDRNKKRKDGLIANMNFKMKKNTVLSGIYTLTPTTKSEIAKMGSWIVEIKFISNTCDDI